MKNICCENKKSFILFISLFVFLLVYDLFLIPHINDIVNIKNVNEIHKLYDLHPLLPLSRLVYNLYPVQYFDSVGFKEIIITFTYVVNSFSIFEIMFLLLIIYNFYLFLFERNHLNSLSFLMVGLHIIIFIVHMTYTMIKVFNSFVFINYPVSVAMISIRNVSIIALTLYLIVLLLSCLTLFKFVIKKN